MPANLTSAGRLNSQLGMAAARFRPTSEVPLYRPCRYISPRRIIEAICLFSFVVYASTSFRRLQGFSKTSAAHVGRAKSPGSQTLAIVVPAHSGDLKRALASLSRWPKTCSPSTVQSVELVLYYAEGPMGNTWYDEVVQELNKTGGTCFARTRIVFANLTEEEDRYPLGPSVQFYKLFLDNTVREPLAHFDAIAILEWDVLITSDKSFEQLYHAAFDMSEPFWVKGSTLAGTNFHDTSAKSDQWHVLGHINGNAIYNNTDPAFVEFVEFTLARWGYTYSYDVALWATISDFPYSWPLWQRFSGKFVSTNLIANVGFFDVDSTTVSRAARVGTMFIHGSRSGGGGAHFLGKVEGDHLNVPTVTTELGAFGRPLAEQCTSSCGHRVNDPTTVIAVRGTSTVCDHTCTDLGVKEDRRFGGLSCGAGNVEVYGGLCRRCYVDVDEARTAESLLKREAEAREASNAGGWGGGGQHVIMCDTMRPPESANCSSRCASKSDTVCDNRCGSGWFGDYNCNWRDHGPHCRFCFRDVDAAILADVAARGFGGRVIMCDTHEPPVALPRESDNKAIEEVPDSAGAKNDIYRKGDGASLSPNGDGSVPLTPRELPYVDGILRGNICAFTTGYFVFLAETEAAVKSVVRFMPGITMVVATDPPYFSVFNRTIGHLPGVAVANGSTAGGHASLLADIHCGEDTKLIYYMEPGEIISRPFTSKDTHSTSGRLLVQFTELERVGAIHAKRSEATTSVLGFGAPSFTHGADILLPAGLNQKLRRFVVAAGSSQLSAVPARPRADEEIEAMSLIQLVENAHVPEMLAALAYSGNRPDVWFFNPQQWVLHHMFHEASIWDIPLIKPRFGCSTSTWLAAEGYDVARELYALSDSRGGRHCETGFLALDTTQLQAKPSVEFGSAVGGLPMPSIEDFRVSIMYTVEGEDCKLLNKTLPSVILNFADALEVVVIVKEDAMLSVCSDIVEDVRRFAPFMMAVKRDRIGTEERFPLLWADEYCSGNFVLHLDAGSVIMETITYDHIFHFGKPVIPFTRFKGEGDQGQACWQTKASQAVGAGEPVLHEFSNYDTHVYPIALYPALRTHPTTAEREHALGAVMSNGVCDDGGAAAGASTQEEKRRFRGVMQYSLMVTFMWYWMNDSVHWRAIDALDVKPDEWLTDPQKYAWACRVEAQDMSRGGGWAAGKFGQTIYENEAGSSTRDCEAVLANLQAESVIRRVR